MEHVIIAKPDFAMARVGLADGESIVTEAGAMVAMSSNLEVKTQARGGVLSSLARAALGGESFFVNTYTARGGPGKIDIAPSVPGDIHHIPLDGTLYVQSGSYLAAAQSVDVSTSWQGAKGFFSGEGFFMLQCNGKGDLFLASYGGIHEVQVNGSYIVDTGHIVAFDSTLTYNIQRVGGWKATLFSGEGLVCNFSGTGRVLTQSRAVRPFAAWIHPYRRVQKQNN